MKRNEDWSWIASFSSKRAKNGLILICRSTGIKIRTFLQVQTLWSHIISCGVWRILWILYECLSNRFSRVLRTLEKNTMVFHHNMFGLTMLNTWLITSTSTLFHFPVGSTHVLLQVHIVSKTCYFKMPADLHIFQKYPVTNAWSFTSNRLKFVSNFWIMTCLLCSLWL